MQTFVYQGDTWGDVASWVEGGGGSLRPLFIAAGNGRIKYNPQTGLYEIGQYLKDVTEEQMINIYNDRLPALVNLFRVKWPLYDRLRGSKARYCLIDRAYFGSTGGQYWDLFRLCIQSSIEVWDLALRSVDMGDMFNGCSSLRHVSGLRVAGDTVSSPLSGTFSGCVNLIECKIHDVKGNLSLASSAKIEIESVLFLISNTSNNATLKLHPDVYAKAIADERITTALQQHTNVSLTT